MNWRELLGLKPRIEDFAAELLRNVADQDEVSWTFDREQNVLRSSKGAQINLVNIFLEYANASRRGRRELLKKYASMLTVGQREVPNLWTLAAKGLYLTVRSKYDYMVLSIEGRSNEEKYAETVAWPFVDDLCLRLVYDFGPNMAHVSKEQLDTWGQDEHAVRQQALNNLKSLQRPTWVELEERVYRLHSEVSYEETWFLVDSVMDQLPFGPYAAVMPVNRGVLLAADRRSEQAVSAMLATAFVSLQENPWPLSATMLTREGGEWRKFEGEGLVAERAHAVATLNRAGTYKDQQSALQLHYESRGEDIFVASVELRQRGDDIAGVYSWCVWPEEVTTLLPQTDVIVFGKGDPQHGERIVVGWADAMQVCGGYLQRTDEDPPRFRVEQFPNDDEWRRLKQVGEALN